MTHPLPTRNILPQLPLLVCLLTACLAATLAGQAKPPNILFILADDLGYGDLSCYNPESKIPTPHIDRLAAGGIRFTDAHSPSTVCTPTRYSILTGRMAFRTGNRSVFTGAGGPNMIEQGRLTLPEMLRNQGYATALVGKWHVGLTFSDSKGKPIHQGSPDALKRVDFTRPIPDSPIHRGFDRFFGTACCPTTDWLYAFIDGDRVPIPPTRLIDKSRLPKNPYTGDCRPGMIAPDFDMEEIDMTLHQTWTLDLAIRQSDWKFLDHRGSGGNRYETSAELKPFILPDSDAEAPGQLYNLADDPGERRNLYHQHPEIVSQLKARLEKSKASGRSAPKR
jgi:arylsulfatase A-like enzyme